jgi:gluconate 5-dehydrogenase
MILLHDKVVLITGSSRGLGWAMAQAFAQAGATVLINGRDRDGVLARVRELAAKGLSAEAAVFDAADPAAAEAALRRIVETHTRLDVLVNNAGAIIRKPFTALTDADWDAVFSVNVTARFRLAQAAAAAMMARGSGAILMISSIVAARTRPEIAAYTAAKGAVSALTRALAVELAPHGIRCNAIAPGYFRTDATAAIADSEFGRALERRIPLRRWGDPADIGAAAVFLASDAASYINGAVLVVDGGLTAAL